MLVSSHLGARRSLSERAGHSPGRRMVCRVTMSRLYANTYTRSCRVTNWEVEHTEQFGEWYGALTDDDAEEISHVIDHLAQEGPVLGRPLVDRVEGSRHHNMKELRVSTKECDYRILFIFDPNRVAYLLIGGDKTGQWKRWYEKNIPYADNLYDERLRELGREQRRHER